MKKNIRSATLTSKEKLVLENLITVFGRNGRSDNYEKWCAITIQWLRDGGKFLETKEGRDLFRLVRKGITNTTWEKALYEEASRKREMKRLHDIMDRRWEIAQANPKLSPKEFEALCSSLEKEQGEAS